MMMPPPRDSLERFVPRYGERMSSIPAIQDQDQDQDQRLCLRRHCQALDPRGFESRWQQHEHSERLLREQQQQQQHQTGQQAKEQESERVADQASMSLRLAPEWRKSRVVTVVGIRDLFLRSCGDLNWSKNALSQGLLRSALAQATQSRILVS